MASMLVQQKVKDFADWKNVYDSAADSRTNNVSYQTEFTATQVTPTA